MISSLLAVLLSLLYLLGFTFAMRRMRSTGALAPLTLPPLLLTDFAAWIAHARIAQNLGTGPSPMWLLGFGGVATMLCAMIAMTIPRNDVISDRRPPVVVPALCWLTSYAALAMPALALTGFTAWNVSLAGAFVSLALLPAVAIAAALANRFAVDKRNQRIALGITALLALLQAAVAWYLSSRA